MSNKRTSQAVHNANWAVDKAMGLAAHWEVRDVAWKTLFRNLEGAGQVISVPVGSALQSARRDDLKHPTLLAFLREASTRSIHTKKSPMSNGRTNRTVSGAVDVWWAVWWAVIEPVRDAVSGAVDQVVSRAVHGSWHGDVYWALQQDPDPPGFKDFLLSLKPDTRT